jgi:hypothetical protein
MHLHVEDTTVVNVQAYDEHYLLKNNTSSSVVNQQVINQQRAYFAVKSIKSETAYQWHQLMTHASSEVIQHLKTSAEKMKITDKSDNLVLKTHECESCALSKMHKIISRSAKNVETSDKSFFRVTYDLMQLGLVFNKNEWVSHFACHAIDFNLVFTHEKKFDASRIVREAINLIETRFSSVKVMFIRSDEEKFLEADFKDFLVEKRISFEPFASDSSKQNDHFERKDEILVIKARVMRIDADLFNYLWLEIIRTTDYIANRTLMKKHQWKTSYELVLRQASNLNNLHLYECKIYALNKHISKKIKLQERAHIDHLIDYEARNIFRIWISSQRKMIRTRDVIFDENSKYDSSDVDLIQIIIELMLETTFES